jgi:sulfur-oxidizing protein SoxX
MIAAGAAATASGAWAAEIDPVAVVYDDYGAIETSLTGVAGDPAAGAKVMVNRGKGNCIACHETTALLDSPFHGEVGPTLDGAGSRWTEEELRGLVANAKITFDGTIMPSFYKSTGFYRVGDAYTGKAGSDPTAPILTAQEVEDVVAYLMTLKDE